MSAEASTQTQQPSPPRREPGLVHLKVKIKSLADESVTIRRETQIALAGPHRDLALAASLREHRVDKVRPAARYAQLAYAFLRGVPLRALERCPHEEPDASRLLKEVKRFSLSHGDLKAWLAEPRLEKTAPISMAPRERPTNRANGSQDAPVRTTPESRDAREGDESIGGSGA